MLRLAFSLLLSSLALTACQIAPARPPGYAFRPPTQLGDPGIGAPGPAAQAGQVAILLPLSGARAELGQAMLKAAQLALETPGSPTLDSRDTGGTPEGAARAARAALAAGDGLILGPLTAAETAAVAPVARQAGVAVLAFTNDQTQAQPGVWTLGITPLQQVRRLVGAAQAQGKTRFAGLLPENDFGRAMGDALVQSAAAAGLAPPTIRTFGRGVPAIDAAMKDLSGYASRRGPIDAQVRASREQSDPEARRAAAETARGSVGAAPFDALLLADTGETLTAIAPLLPYYDIDRTTVRVLGPALWATPNSGSSQLIGAWYAAPDPGMRIAFDGAYNAKYGAPAPGIADLAYDAAQIARVSAQSGGFSAAVLAQPAGYAGADGLLLLLPDGQTRRGLAVFEVQPGGPQIVDPAPQSLGAPGV